MERRLHGEGMIPQTIGRNTYSSESPLKSITQLMDECVGTVVIGLKRTYFARGLDRRRGPREAPLSKIKLATPWNQIEAAMANSCGHLLLVIVERGVKREGLLESGYDWYVQSIDPIPPPSRQRNSRAYWRVGSRI